MNKIKSAFDQARQQPMEEQNLLLKGLELLQEKFSRSSKPVEPKKETSKGRNLS